MEAETKYQICSPHVIYLNNVLTTDVWTRQKRHYFTTVSQQQQQQHGIDSDTSIWGNMDEEFAFHLLDIHAKFCIKPSCRIAMDENNAASLKLNKITVSSNFSKVSNSKSLQKSDDQQTKSLKSVGELTSPVLSCPSTSGCPVEVSQLQEDVGLQSSESELTAPVLTFEIQEAAWHGPISEEGSPDSSHDHATDRITMAIKTEPEGDTTQEGYADCWFADQSHVNMASPDMSHDQATDGMARVIRIEEMDDTTEGKVSEPLVVKREIKTVKTGMPEMKRSQLNTRTGLEKCNSCHRVLQGIKAMNSQNYQEQISPDKCDSCMKEANCSIIETGHGTPSEGAIPGRVGSQSSADNIGSISYSGLYKDPGTEWQERNGSSHESSSNMKWQCSAVESNFDHQEKEKPYECTVCSKAFKRQMDVTRHMRTHTGEKPFSCDLCAKTFTQKESVTLHMRTHTGERPYACKLCGKTFIQSHHLAVHMTKHTGEKPYKCTMCSKSFTCNQLRKRHFAIHTREVQFKCNLCFKAFTEKLHLSLHMKTHTSEGFYIFCEVCCKAFKHEKYLEKHMRTHTGEKPYKCNSCSKAFYYKQGLKRHVRTHTGEGPGN